MNLTQSEKLSPVSTAAQKAAGNKIAVLTAYDYPMARLLEEAQVDWLLVGDSLGMVVLGYPDTTFVTLADMVHHTSAVARGAKNTPIIADLPIGTYLTPEMAVTSARSLIQAGAHAVKLEGGAEFADRIAALVSEGIPTMGHIGMLPQRVREEGGYKIKGRTQAEGDQIVADAVALQHAGAFGMVIELVEPQTTARVTKAVTIPTIGIGSGPHCDGQVLVTQDLIGAFPWFRPRFVTPIASTGEIVKQAAASFVSSTKTASVS
ncbi:MAG: 3-methyl-2-oxobutanoate hydroxymethyltransferase [Verrucomicrobiota bacterium]